MVGYDSTGNNILRRSSYEIKTDADIDQVHAVGKALSSLSESTLYDQRVMETSELLN
ncbi:DUF1659 domain-containing protein [Bacillus solitudinis]|uniref:DUF1659 domain-containing protein n=1 Tax=Bacillus solitudinis TaxID=2014074 RepID=UPI000C2314BC